MHFQAFQQMQASFAYHEWPNGTNSMFVLIDLQVLAGLSGLPAAPQLNSSMPAAYQAMAGQPWLLCIGSDVTGRILAGSGGFDQSVGNSAYFVSLGEKRIDTSAQNRI